MISRRYWANMMQREREERYGPKTVCKLVRGTSIDTKLGFISSAEGSAPEEAEGKTAMPFMGSRQRRIGG